MSDYFIDTSALVKRYMPEKGTLWMRHLTAPHLGNTIIIAQITAVEIMSAMARQFHDGAINLSLLQAFRRQVVHHVRTEYRVLAFSPQIETYALDLHERHRLRAYDAVQLASTVVTHRHAVAIGTTLTFLAADTRLLKAAVAEGLTTDNPDNYA